MLQSLLSLMECLVRVQFHLAQGPLGLKDELIRISVIKVQRSQATVTSHNSRIHAMITHE